MSSPGNPGSRYGQSVTLGALCGLLWRAKHYVAIVTMASAVAGYWVAANMPPVYEAYMVVLPSDFGRFDALVSPGNTGTATANLLTMRQQLSFGTPNELTFEKMRYLLYSDRVAAGLAARPDLTEKLARRLQERLGAAEGPILGADEGKQVPKAAIAQIRDYVRSALHVSRVGRHGMRRIWTRDRDPDIALALLTATFEEADRILRDQQIRAREGERAYLQAKLQEIASVSGEQDAIGLISMLEINLMLLRLEFPFAVEVLEGPLLIPRPVAARPELISGASAWAVFHAFVLVLFWGDRRRPAGAGSWP